MPRWTKIAAIASGFWLCLTDLLGHHGILVVDWNAMNSLGNRFTSSVEHEWGSFQTFITASLPAAALATAGLANRARASLSAAQGALPPPHRGASQGDS